MYLREKVRVFENNGISVSKLASEAKIPCSTLTRYMREKNAVLKIEYEERLLSAMRDIADTLNAVINADNTTDYDDDELDALVSGDK